MFKSAPLMALAAATLSACTGLTPYPGIGDNGELPVIARPVDTNWDQTPLSQARDPGVAYDPDGCQAWILDDGVEGYIGRRRDASSGLPICNNLYPPGAVVGTYETRAAGISDWVPTPAYGEFQGVLREGQCPNGYARTQSGQLVCR